MQRLTVHIGTHKTGTTSFQRTLRDHRKALARQDRVFLIRMQPGFPVQDFMRLQDYDLSFVDRLREHLARNIGDRHGHFIISCEYLSGDRATMYANSALMARMLREATRAYQTEISVLFRRQDEFIQSMYTQIVHRGEPQDLTIEEYSQSFNLELLDWNRFIEPHIDAFGAENVHVYPYDRKVFCAHSVVDLLNRSIGSQVLAGLEQVRRENTGYSRSSLEIARRLNSRLNERQRVILRQVLQEIGHKEFLHEYNLYDRTTKKEIIAFFGESNQRLAARFFQAEFDMCDFSEPVYEEVADAVEDRYSELILQLVRQIDEGSYLDRNCVVRTAKLLRRVFLG